MNKTYLIGQVLIFENTGTIVRGRQSFHYWILQFWKD